MINIITGASNENSIFLDGGNCLSVKDVGPILGIQSPYRPVLVEEMNNVLKDRKNHITERFFLKDDTVYFEKFDDNNTNSFNLNSDLSSNTRDWLQLLHSELFNSQETTIYSSSEITFDLINGSAILDLIDWDEYTRYVGIGKIKQFAKKSGISAKIDLSIKYSIKDTESEEFIIGGEDITFKAFEYDTNSNLICNDFITDLDCGIRVEYVDSTVRITPINSEIKECIISNCIVSYGNLKYKES